MRAGLLLQQRKEQYARDMTREMGKVLAETRGDVQEAIDEAFYVAGEGRRLFGVTTPSELQNKFAMSVRMPVGVVGMIAPWNFPMAIPSWKLFPALISGNACVIKPAEDTPLSTHNLVQALMDAGLPPGVVNIVNGFGPEAGAPLVEHPDVRAISFTGSSEVGSIVAQRAAATFKPVSLEMGGKNAQIVMDDANVPSLLGLPYLESSPDAAVYARTRRFVWSSRNPWFFSGAAGEGIGGPLIGRDSIWPMSQIIFALTSRSEAEIARMLQLLKAGSAGTGFIHESYHKENPQMFTRSWFAWANTLFGELIAHTVERSPDLLRGGS